MKHNTLKLATLTAILLSTTIFAAAEQAAQQQEKTLRKRLPFKATDFLPPKPLREGEVEALVPPAKAPAQTKKRIPFNAADFLPPKPLREGEVEAPRKRTAFNAAAFLPSSHASYSGALSLASSLDNAKDSPREDASAVPASNLVKSAYAQLSPLLMAGGLNAMEGFYLGLRTFAPIDKKKKKEMRNALNLMVYASLRHKVDGLIISGALFAQDKLQDKFGERINISSFIFEKMFDQCATQLAGGFVNSFGSAKGAIEGAIKTYSNSKNQESGPKKSIIKGKLTTAAKFAYNKATAKKDPNPLAPEPVAHAADWQQKLDKRLVGLISGGIGETIDQGVAVLASDIRNGLGGTIQDFMDELATLMERRMITDAIVRAESDAKVADVELVKARKNDSDSESESRGVSPLLGMQASDADKDLLERRMERLRKVPVGDIAALISKLSQAQSRIDTHAITLAHNAVAASSGGRIFENQEQKKRNVLLADSEQVESLERANIEKARLEIPINAAELTSVQAEITRLSAEVLTRETAQKERIRIISVKAWRNQPDPDQAEAAELKQLQTQLLAATARQKALTTKHAAAQKILEDKITQTQSKLDAITSRESAEQALVAKKMRATQDHIFQKEQTHQKKQAYLQKLKKRNEAGGLHHIDEGRQPSIVQAQNTARSKLSAYVAGKVTEYNRDRSAWFSPTRIAFELNNTVTAIFGKDEFGRDKDLPAVITEIIDEIKQDAPLAVNAATIGGISIIQDGEKAVGQAKTAAILAKQLAQKAMDNPLIAGMAAVAVGVGGGFAANKLGVPSAAEILEAANSATDRFLLNFETRIKTEILQPAKQAFKPTAANTLATNILEAGSAGFRARGTLDKAIGLYRAGAQLAHQTGLTSMIDSYTGLPVADTLAKATTSGLTSSIASAAAPWLGGAAYGYWVNPEGAKGIATAAKSQGDVVGGTIVGAIGGTILKNEIIIKPGVTYVLWPVASAVAGAGAVAASAVGIVVAGGVYCYVCPNHSIPQALRKGAGYIDDNAWNYPSWAFGGVKILGKGIVSTLGLATQGITAGVAGLGTTAGALAGYKWRKPVPKLDTPIEEMEPLQADAVVDQAQPLALEKSPLSSAAAAVSDDDEGNGSSDDEADGSSDDE